MEKTEVFLLVGCELNNSLVKFPLYHSSHEGYAVLKEEVDELWGEIKSNKLAGSKERQVEEAIQVAATAIKFIMSITK